jgi:branched-chain amino acid transport system permease protein
VGSGFEQFLSTSLLYVLLYTIGAWGLNVQFGSAGIVNFGFIIFQAIGAYTVAICTLGHTGLVQGSQTAFAAFTLPFPLPLVAAVAAGVAGSAVVGVVVLRRVKSDQQAVVLFVLALISVAVVNAIPGFLNGPTGLALIPQPLAPNAAPGPGYDWAFLGVTAALAVLCWLFVRALHESPYGRALRALRENDSAAEALGYNLFSLRMTAFCVGGGLAALAGGIFAYFVTTWSPASWGYSETFWLFAAVIVGGMGNLGGIFVGSLVVVGLQQAFQYVPSGTSELGVALQVGLASLVTIVFLWLRPQGILPERLHRIYGRPRPVPEPGQLVEPEPEREVVAARADS